MKYIKKICVILALVPFISCINSDKNKTIDNEANVLLYKKDDVTLELKYVDRDRQKIHFNLNIESIGLHNFQGIANLVLIEDIDGKLIVPEGTNCTDYNNPNDIWGMGYRCDSTYSYDADSLIDFDFAKESTIKLYPEYEGVTKHRLDFLFQKKNKDGKTLIGIYKTLLPIHSQ